jgi:hypothetical protein
LLVAQVVADIQCKAVVVVLEDLFTILFTRLQQGLFTILLLVLGARVVDLLLTDQMALILYGM